MDQLKTVIKEYTDDRLLDQYLHHKDDYTPEAAAVMFDEIKRRNLDLSEKPSGNDPEQLHFDSNDFTPFDHLFHQVDLQLVAAMFRDNDILFYIDNPHSTGTLPIESEADRLFSIHVHNKSIPKAQKLLDELFDKTDGRYQIKTMSTKEKLKSFSFHEFPISETESEEEAGVLLNAQEKECILTYGRRVVSEAEKIESEKERVIFYYDSIEPLLERISKKEHLTLTTSDLLTILEIFQIFCDEPDFPEFIEDSVSSLLSFFQTGSR